jgi:hypothetical protein
MGENQVAFIQTVDLEILSPAAEFSSGSTLLAIAQTMRQENAFQAEEEHNTLISKNVLKFGTK